MKEFGLVGRKLGHSFSKNYFSQKFQAEKLANISYQNFELPKISDIQTVFETPDLKGFNVTIPYKEEILPYLDKLDKSAKVIGAVNTVKNEQGIWVGYNTDWIGFKESLINFLDINLSESGITALVLGTGGAAKAVWFALDQLDIPYQKVSRATGQDSGVIQYEDIGIDGIVANRLIINTTPLGMHPNTEAKPSLQYKGFTQDHFAYDLIYNPSQTEFMLSAAMYGAKTINGYKMLVKQAEAAWEIWNH